MVAVRHLYWAPHQVRGDRVVVWDDARVCGVTGWLCGMMVGCAG